MVRQYEFCQDRSEKLPIQFLNKSRIIWIQGIGFRVEGLNSLKRATKGLYNREVLLGLFRQILGV